MLFIRTRYRHKNIIVEVSRKVGNSQYSGRVLGVSSYKKGFLTTNKKNIQQCVNALADDCLFYLKSLKLPQMSVFKLDTDEKKIAYALLSGFEKIMYFIGALNWNLSRIRVLHPVGFIVFFSIIITIPIISYATGSSATTILNETFDEFCLWD